MKIVIGILLAAGIAAAQSPKSDWTNLKKVAAGEEIRVSMSDGKSFRGQLQSTTDESLIMVAASAQQTLARPQIAKIAIKGASHRTRNALIGLGVGAGGGLAIGAGVDHGCARCLFGRNLGKEIFTPMGALVGLVVGVAWPTGGWHDVYRSK
jgi:small nuclear ribonucleoprotein (snRNP)-like protein